MIITNNVMEHHLTIQMVLHIFFFKPFWIRNYSANTVGSTRCKRKKHIAQGRTQRHPGCKVISGYKSIHPICNFRSIQ